MTPLLDALVAAQKAGFDASKCQWCSVGWQAEHEDFRIHCDGCHATGLDASDPFGIIGRADLWLHGRACDVLRRWATNEVVVDWDVPASALPPQVVARELIEVHDGTPAGLATALLRLVARVGGAA